MNVVHIDEHLSFSFLTVQDARKSPNSMCSTAKYIVIDQASNQADTNRNLSNLLLRRMLSSTNATRRAIEQCPGEKILICQPNNHSITVRESALLFGCYLVLARGRNQQQVAHLFKNHSHLPIPDAETHLSPLDTHRSISLLDCWQALQHVRDIGWMDWMGGTDNDEQPFLVDEFMHYADTANGGVHIVAPGQLLLFSDPVDLASNQQWVSVAVDGGTCTRHFSPTFYADLFEELGVAAVACLTESGSSGAAFAARGIEARDLCPGESGSTLRALDGLLSLSRGAAPGAVAVHGGGEGGWGEDAGVVVAAWLVNRAGFGEGAAYAWLHMLCPWLLRGV